MKILVPLKQILSPGGLTVNRKAGKVFVNQEAYVINPASKCALEAALRIKDTQGAEVMAVTLGSAQADDCLREARALGADRVVRVECGPVDSAGVIRAVTALIDHVGGVDLIINGHRTLDSGVSSGAGLAEALGWPYLGEAVECSIEGRIVRIARQGDSDSRHYDTFEADLPAVVTVTRAGPKPRYAHGGDIILAYRDPHACEVLTPAELGLGESDLQLRTAERGQAFPPEREFGKTVTTAELAARLVMTWT